MDTRRRPGLKRIHKGNKDAIHVAVISVEAGEQLLPGDKIFLDVDTLVAKKRGTNYFTHGIVDPFLRWAVYEGECFDLWLYPNFIEGMRHNWKHGSIKDYPEESEDVLKQRAEVQLISIADTFGLSFNRLMRAAQEYLEDGTYLCEGGRWEGMYLPDEFWDFYEVYTGKIVPDETRGSFFSCSC